MKITTFVANALAITAITVLASTSVSAQYGQYGVYGQYGPGGTPAQSLFVEKLVGKPGAVTKGGIQDVQYVDNISVSDPRFKPGQEVSFRIKVKNTANTALTGITLKDYFPQYLDAIEGPGSYDNASRTITASVGNLQPNEEKNYTIKARIVPQNLLPADKGVMCLVNKAVASNDKVSDDDTAQFCVEKDVTGVTNVPSAGPEMGLLLFGGELSLLGLGFFMRKKIA